ncbi:MAG: MerR family transcriptional regulator [Lentisphaeria bacterium]|nr:MerR family transcriptional regulator [Lentisphaeria bacterium]
MEAKEEEKYLSVMDLASLVGVPRTTVNDWLGKYSQFINSVQQGKRKVYPQSTVAILKEIGSLRAAGLSFPEIERKLAATHPLQALPDPEEKGEETGEKASVPPSPAGETPAETENAATAPAPGALQVIAPSGDDFARLVENMALLSAKVMEEEKKRSASLRLAAGVFLLFFLVILGGFGLFYHHFRLLSDAKDVLEKKNSETGEKLLRSEKDSLALRTENSGFKASIKQLEKELDQQRKSFECAIRNSLEENRKALREERKRNDELLSEKEAKIALEREKFAAERLRLLRELEKARNENEKRKEALPAEKPKTSDKSVPQKKDDGKKTVDQKKETVKAAPQKKDGKEPGKAVSQKKDDGKKTADQKKKETVKAAPAKKDDGKKTEKTAPREPEKEKKSVPGENKSVK